MPDRSFLSWPFFEDRHREWAERLEAWCAANLPVDHHDVDAACRELVNMLGRDGWLKPTAIDPANPSPLDVRMLCLTRETLARHDGLADFAFAMQGLGAGAISLFGSPEHKQWLTKTRAGEAIAAFALSEPRSGSDVANMDMAAARDDDHYVLSGEKTWISNGGIADFYVVFARTGEAPGAKGISAFLVPADANRLDVAERLEVIAPHPLARLSFDAVRVPVSAMIGKPGDGFKIAMSVLDLFRSTVGAAALGFARRALDESVKRAAERQLFGAPMAELQMVQGHIADMALDVDAAALLVYRAAWTKDMGAARVTREAAMAKLFATDRAQEVIDKAVQLHGGDGVRRGHIVESLYREIRALRIYEGASDVQKVVIARQTLASVGIQQKEGTDMTQDLNGGITPNGEGFAGVEWNILGQRYFPKAVCETTFAFETNSAPGQFVPVHIHPNQDEFILVQEGELDVKLNGVWSKAKAGDLVRMPKGIPHGYFNKSDKPTRALFWVSPAGKLKDLFEALHDLQDIPRVIELSARHEVDFLPPEANE